MSKKIEDLDDLNVRDFVIIKPKYYPKHLENNHSLSRYQGIVSALVAESENRGVTNSPIKTRLYVSFIDNTAYHNLLQIGYPLMCSIKNVGYKRCYVDTFVRENGLITTLTVGIDDACALLPMLLPNKETYTIKIDDIVSILIMETAYTIYKV
jgi:hypothetical protein